MADSERKYLNYQRSGEVHFEHHETVSESLRRRLRRDQEYTRPEHDVPSDAARVLVLKQDPVAKFCEYGDVERNFVRYRDDIRDTVAAAPESNGRWDHCR